jgi:hypothetical protein
LSFDLRERGYHLDHRERGDERGKPRVHRLPEYTTLLAQSFRSRRGVESPGRGGW